MLDSFNKFVEQNRQLASFLSLFADADLMGLEDDEVAHQYANTAVSFWHQSGHIRGMEGKILEATCSRSLAFNSLRRCCINRTRHWNIWH